MNILKVEDLSYSYNDVKVLENVNFSIFENEFVAIIGNNGAGKTTLLKLLTNNLQIQQGKINIKYNSIGYVKQKINNPSNFPTTVKELVLSSTYHQKGFLKYPSKKEKKEALNMIDKVGIKDLKNRLLSKLSGGQLQRAMIARALATKSSILILDEPTSGIDPSSVDSIFSLLKALSQEKSILVVTHDLNMVLKYATRIFCLENGNILELPKSQLQHEISHKHQHKDQYHDKCDHCILCEKGGNKC